MSVCSRSTPTRWVSRARNIETSKAEGGIWAWGGCDIVLREGAQRKGGLWNAEEWAGSGLVLVSEEKRETIGLLVLEGRKGCGVGGDITRGWV